MTKNIHRPMVLLVLLAEVVLLLALTSGPAHAATTFTVNKSGDARDRTIDGVCDTSRERGKQCTLRAAIQEANYTPGADNIAFNIVSTATVKTISPTRPLPPITESVIIDGYTQGSQTADTSDDAKPNDNPLFSQGSNAIIKVQLKGTNAGATANGLRVTASGSTIKGLAINRFAQSGILIRGSGATGNVVEGTFIGTNASGTRALPNLGNGVRINGAPENTIGPSEAGVAGLNLISGNGSDGVEISGSGAELNIVNLSFIGTDAARIKDLGNAGDGVHIGDAPNNNIGPGPNLIAHNDSDGISITGSGATGNTVGRNSIQENSAHGVHIEGASNNTIGEGSGTGIFNNGGDGVFVSSGTGNRISADNSFGGNGGLGIDLSGGTEDSFGVTANDVDPTGSTDDSDTGANNLQNFPVLTSVVHNFTTETTTISGTLNSTPNQTFTIHPYTSFSFGEDPSDHGEGEAPFYGNALPLVTTDDNGNGTFSWQVEGLGPPNGYVTVTATNVATGDTSEFSENVSVTLER